MAKPPSTWTAFERWVGRQLGGDRRGAMTSRERGGKNDLINVPGLAVECKFGKQMGYKKILDALLQAEADRDDPNELPIAVVKLHSYNNNDSVVAIRFEVFKELYLALRVGDLSVVENMVEVEVDSLPEVEK